MSWLKNIGSSIKGAIKGVGDLAGKLVKDVAPKVLGSVPVVGPIASAALQTVVGVVEKAGNSLTGGHSSKPSTAAVTPSNVATIMKSGAPPSTFMTYVKKVWAWIRSNWWIALAGAVSIFLVAFIALRKKSIKRRRTLINRRRAAYNARSKRAKTRRK